MTDLERAYTALSSKTFTYGTLWQYYRGEQPLMYTTQRLRELFKDLRVYCAENWCRVVINAVKERIELRRLEMPTAQLQDDFDALWTANELSLEADDVHTAALVCGESFIVAWPDTDGAPQAYYNDPRLCHVFYEAENPRRKRFAAKWWDDDDGKKRLTLYYPDRLEYYVSSGNADAVQSAKAFVPLPDTPTALNPYGEIPVFHFRTPREIESDLQDTMPLQNAVNKLLADMMVAAEYGAFPMRWAITNASIAGKIKNAPNEIAQFPPAEEGTQNTEIGQFPAAELKNYLEAIQHLVSVVSAITDTPQHYFMGTGTDAPSGEALIVMESPLTKKVQDRIDRFIPTWRAVGAFLFKLQNVAVNPRAIIPDFDRVTTIQPRTERDVALIDKQLGVSRQTLLTDLGYDADLEAKQREAEQGELAETMLTTFDRDQNVQNA